MSSATIVALCPVFNPPPELGDRLAEIQRQVADVIVVDDGSDLPGDVPATIRLGSNQGIAAALNEGVREAVRMGASHVLTIDQDSRFPGDYVSQLLSCAQRARELGLCPGAVGAVEFSGLRHTGHFDNGVMVVAESIQSGTLFDLRALERIGGFDESLVIDGVDTDVCLRLQDAGFDVVAAPVAFEHRLGDGHFVSLLGRQVWSSKHAPFRRYYITRNGLLLLRRHGRRHLRWAAVSARRLLVATALAAQDPQQRSAVRAGLADGLRGRRGRQWRPSDVSVGR